MAFERDEDDEDLSDAEEPADDDDDSSLDAHLGEFDDGPPPPPKYAHLTPESKRQQAEYWGRVDAENWRLDDEGANRTRGPNKDYAGNGISDKRMSQGETALRCVKCIAESSLFSDLPIEVRLGGAEVRRNDERPEFPVRTFLARHSFSKERNNEKWAEHWLGVYTHGPSGRQLLLNPDKFDAHIVAFFATGERLVVHCTAGNLDNTRSPAERHDLNRVIGRAVSWPGSREGDISAVCTPRTDRFRKLADARRESVGVKKAGLLFLLVDRGGGIMGLPGQSS